LLGRSDAAADTGALAAVVVDDVIPGQLLEVDKILPNCLGSSKRMGLVPEASYCDTHRFDLSESILAV
jgi:hypothetical protein